LRCVTPESPPTVGQPPRWPWDRSRVSHNESPRLVTRSTGDAGVTSWVRVLPLEEDVAAIVCRESEVRLKIWNFGGHGGGPTYATIFFKLLSSPSDWQITAPCGPPKFLPFVYLSMLISYRNIYWTKRVIDTSGSTVYPTSKSAEGKHLT
jgi:hypothetical protein